MMNEKADGATAHVVELRAILAAIRAGEEKAPLVDRLIDAADGFTGEREEAALLAKIGACRGWAGIVTKLPRPAKSSPALRVVTEESEDSEQTEQGVRQPPAGLPVGWRDPPMWVCSATGIYYQKDTPEGPVLARLLQRPLWIGRRWKDVDGGAWTVDVQWPGGSAIVGREVAMDSRGIIGLAAKGAPVGSSSARAAAQWLEISEQHNVRIVPVETAISRLGWTEAGEVRALQTPAGPHMLRAEEGHAQTARAVGTAGLRTQWLSMAAEVNRSPVAAIMLAASVASVMLEATGAPPFVVDLHGLTSQGKTTALRWAASAWADPGDGAAYILPWSATLAAIEGRAGFLRHLPLMLDDTKKVAPIDRPKIAGVVYQWGSGQGKARGHTHGVREVATWRSILLSTGEAPLTRLAGEHAGLRLRVLPIDAQPFPAGAAAVSLIGSMREWGHAGPMVAAWTVQNWTELRARWERHREAAAAQMEAGPQGGRIAEYIASIWLAVEALAAVGVPMPALSEMKALLVRAGQQAVQSADLATEAWDRVGTWLATQRGRVLGAVYRLDSAPPPHAGWIGRVVGPGDVAVAPAAMEDELRRQGYDPEEMIPQWAAKGLLKMGGASPKVNTRFEGVVIRMYRLNLEGWVEADEPTQPEPPPGDGYHR